MHKQTLIFAISFLCLLPIYGQESQELENLSKQIQGTKGKLTKLRDEIKRYENRITRSRKQERDALSNVYDLEEAISLKTRFIKALDQEVEQLSRAIDDAQTLIIQGEADIANLKSKLADRFIHIYMQERASLLELVITSESWSQAIYRAKYLRTIIEYDTYLTDKVKSEISRLNERQNKMSADLVDRRKLRSERADEEADLQGKKTQYNKDIARLKKDRYSAQRLLTEKKQAAVEMDRILANLENNRVKRERELAEIRRSRGLAETPAITFYKGKLPWPAQGRIVSRFGQQHNRELNTITDNPGIDIKTLPGADVAASLGGLVTTITYIRGYGTTIIIDHGKELYTVYTHVVDVLVGEGEYVDQNQLIAKVNDNNSLEGIRLHFEVWANRVKQNPEEWLAPPFVRYNN